MPVAAGTVINEDDEETLPLPYNFSKTFHSAIYSALFSLMEGHYLLKCVHI